MNVKAQIYDSNEYSVIKFKTVRLSYYRGIKHDIQKRMDLLYVSIKLKKLILRNLQAARQANQTGVTFLIGCKGDCDSLVPEEVIK
jgi:hypothetical protein